MKALCRKLRHAFVQRRDASACPEVPPEQRHPVLPVWEHPVLLRAGRTVAVLDVAVDWELLPVEGGPWVAVDISREEESG